MLTKQHRFSFRNGIPTKSANCSLFVLRYEGAESFSCAIVVSKKVSAHAVERNRIKRMYKKVIREILKTQELPYSMVFYTRKKNTEASIDEIRQSVQQIFKKEGIIVS